MIRKVSTYWLAIHCCSSGGICMLGRADVDDVEDEEADAFFPRLRIKVGLTPFVCPRQVPRTVFRIPFHLSPKKSRTTSVTAESVSSQPSLIVCVAAASSFTQCKLPCSSLRWWSSCQLSMRDFGCCVSYCADAVHMRKSRGEWCIFVWTGSQNLSLILPEFRLVYFYKDHVMVDPVKIEAFWGELKSKNVRAQGLKRTISYQREAWAVTNGIRAYIQLEVWPTKTLGSKRRGDYDNHQSLKIFRDEMVNTPWPMGRIFDAPRNTGPSSF